MAQNLQICPTTRDYVTQNGSPIPSDRVQEAAFIAINYPQGQCLYGATGQGSLIYTLKNIKRTSSIEQLFASYVQQALKSQLIDTGKATSDTITNLSATRYASSNEIDIVPAAQQLSSQLNFIPV